MIDKNQPIIVKKIKKGGHGHHGGAWKVAYADFVTAMMAFFLLMWLLASTTPQQMRAIADYFQNPSPVFGTGGASTSMIDMGASVDIAAMKMGKQGDPMADADQTNVAAMAEKVEQQRLEQLKSQLEQAIEKNPELKGFRQQMMIEMTDEGLRIQLLDEQDRPMFDLGSARVKPYMNKILHMVAKVVNEVPNKVSITGHTDARPYPGQRGYTNWELSSDRANASRRILIAGGMNPDRIGRVEGLSSNVLLYKERPLDPRNRRISITVLKKKALDDIARKAVSSVAPVLPAATGAASAAAAPVSGTAPAAVSAPVAAPAPMPTKPAPAPVKAPAAPAAPAAVPAKSVPAATSGTPPPLFKLPAPGS